MNLIFCVDKKGGMLFHKRRLSFDRIVCEKILNISGGALSIAPYSRSLFPSDVELQVSDEFLAKAGEASWCFVETVDPAEYMDRVEKIVIFYWNRVYPSELKFSLDILQFGWKLIHSEEFQGYSHERITMEVYQRCQGIY